MKSKNQDYYKRFKRKPKYVYYNEHKFLVTRYDDHYFYLSNGKKIKRHDAQAEPGVNHITLFVDFDRKKLIRKENHYE